MSLRARLLKSTKPAKPVEEIPEELIQLDEERKNNIENVIDFDFDIDSETEADITEKTEQENHVDEYLSPHELKYRNEVLSKVHEAIDLSRIGKLNDEEARHQIRDLAQSVIVELDIPLSIESRKKIVQIVEDEILGLGPLEFLMRDYRVTEIMVNGANHVFVEKSGKIQKSAVVFDDDTHVMRVIDRIVSRVGRRVDESSPMADARLMDGSRVNVIIPPLALDGPTITIRRFPSDPLTLATMVEKNALSAAMAAFLTAVVKIGKNSAM